MLIVKEKLSLFYKNLDNVLSVKNVKFFQLRLKKVRKKSLIKVARKIKKITLKHSVKFIINDDPILAKKLNADGLIALAEDET